MNAERMLDAELLKAKYGRFLVNRQVRGLVREKQKKANRRRRSRIRRLSYLLIPLIILIRLIRPLKLIRFGTVMKHKIGHCPLEAELYLLERAAGIQPRNALDLFHFPHRTDGYEANSFCTQLVRDNLLIHPFFECLWIANSLLPGKEKHEIVIQSRDYVIPSYIGIGDVHNLMPKFPVQIQLTGEHERLGKAMLAEMGIPEDADFICIHNRDSTYWADRKKGISDDSDFRNSATESYYPVMLHLAERGFYVVRLGALTETSLPDLHPRVIDYPNNHRSEFMDIYLAARCKLMISTGSGIDSISYFHRRPLLLVNLVGWHHAFPNYMQPSRVILKLFRDRTNGRMIPLEEIRARGLQRLHLTQQFEDNNILLINNSSEDIIRAADEMLAVLEGKLEEEPAIASDILRAREAMIDGRPEIVAPHEICRSFLKSYPEFFRNIDSSRSAI
jgi:putative glycosyltransferase (TIGR04372 family)